MLIQDKIKKLINAINSGISVYKLDPPGKGGSAKLLLEGKMPTHRKINFMYNNLLILEKQEDIPDVPYDNQDNFLAEEKLRLNKIEKIIQAANSGIPHNAIDPKGNGGSIRRLLKGGNSSKRKIDQMYENILAFQQEQILIKEKSGFSFTPHDNPTKEQKIDAILQAIASGVQKSKIDPNGWGKSIRRLQDGKGVLPATLDFLYSNLLEVMGYSQGETKRSVSSLRNEVLLQQQISSLQCLVANLVDKIKALETTVSIIQNELLPAKKKQPKVILGATITRRFDKSHGRKYPRWYAIYKDKHNRKRWIYIGVNLSLAKEKIIAWFERYPQDVRKSSSRGIVMTQNNNPQHFTIPDFLWKKVAPLIPPRSATTGRKPFDNRKAFTAICYILRSGIQWRLLPRYLGAKNTIHDRFKLWSHMGVFHKLWKVALQYYNEQLGIRWRFQAMDGAQIVAPLGGDKTGPSYKHRSKNGSNRSLLTDAKGLPLSIVLASADRNDMTLTKKTLENIHIQRPDPKKLTQHICLDKGYDYPIIDRLLQKWQYVIHTRRKGEDYVHPSLRTYKPRRWVVERTHAWFNNFRSVFIRWCKLSELYVLSVMTQESFLHERLIGCLAEKAEIFSPSGESELSEQGCI